MSDKPELESLVQLYADYVVAPMAKPARRA
jgi:hypothetical protein